MNKTELVECCGDTGMGIPAADQQPQIVEQLNRLRSSIQKARGLKEHLYEKLNPILRPEKENKAGDVIENSKQTPDKVAPLADEIRANFREVQALVNDFREIIDRLEI